MKKQKSKKSSSQPVRHNHVILGQLIKLIPPSIIRAASLEFGVDAQARTFTVLSHLAAMLFVQLAHALSLNDVCDWMRLKGKAIAAFGITPPARNTLAHANKVRSAKFVEQVFWKTLEHLSRAAPGFSGKHPGKRRRNPVHRFKKAIHAIDSTTMELVANCMDWAKHRRRKAAAKMHMRLGVNGFLPTFAIVDVAKEHDNKRARELCAGLQDGEIALFDKAYVDFQHLWDLCRRGVRWVTRAKDNMQYKVVKKLPVKKGSRIVKDQIIKLTGAKFQDMSGWTFRLVEAWVEVDGKDKLMTFITNGTEWSPRSVCDLYKARWEIEVFFKQVKQTLKLSGFVGYSANALRWQVWTALLVYVLLRFQGFQSDWGHSFTRLFAVTRAAMWERWDLQWLLKSYGTAGGGFKLIGRPAYHNMTPWLEGMKPAFEAG
jgi:IS4 transposase